MNGLSAAGSGLASFAATAGLEAQRADAATALQASGGVIQGNLMTQKAGLEQQQAILADQLATTREAGGRTQAAGIASTAADKEMAFKSAEAEKARQAVLNAPTPEIKSAQQFSKLSPDEKRAYREEAMVKAGLPPWMIGDDQAGGPVPTAPVAPDSSGTTPAITGDTTATPPATTPSRPGLNEAALNKFPAPAVSLIKGMVDGRISPPSSFAASKPYWQNLIQMATTYDPTFDETSWAGRVATRKDFASGKSAQAVTAMNTALSHAATLADDFDKMGNTSLPVLNYALNNAGQAFGGAALSKATETRDALASEARKVFAASGGGNLTELQEWQKNFPLNGSPAQQKAALVGFVDLLDGRLQGLADQYNRGMGKTDDPMTLLQPKARAAYEKLSGRPPPTDAVGYQTGKPPTTGPNAAATTQDAEAGTSTASPATPSKTVPAAPLPSWKAAPDGTQFKQGGTTYIKQGDDPSKWPVAP